MFIAAAPANGRKPLKAEIITARFKRENQSKFFLGKGSEFYAFAFFLYDRCFVWL